MKEISVVIPVQITSDERLAILREALDHLLAQTLPSCDYEIILIDDNSSIDLRQSLSGLLTKHNIISLFQSKSHGPAAARNQGTRAAQGKIILYLGSDVIIQKNLLQEHHNVHKLYENVSVTNPIYAPKEAIFGKGYLETMQEAFQEGVVYKLADGSAFCTNCVSIKKNIIQEEMFDENFKYPAYEDIDVGYRLYQKGIGTMVAKKTSALHKHIHSIASWRARSRNFGEALTYLTKKNPGLQTCIKCNPNSLAFVIKKMFYLCLLPIAETASRIPFVPLKKYGVEILCRYDFIKGAEKTKPPAMILKIIGFLLSLTRINKLKTVIFFVTNKCNARCLTCFYWDKLNQPVQELNIEEIQKIADKLGHFETLQISGGEPYLREELSEICAIFVKTNKIKNIHIPTNGLLTETICSETDKIARMDKTINVFLCLAMDGLGQQHDTIRGVPGNFEKLLRTIESLKQLQKNNDNLSFAVITTVCENNFKNYEKIHSFVTQELKVAHMTDIVRINTARQKQTENIPQDFLEKVLSLKVPMVNPDARFSERLRGYIQGEQSSLFNSAYLQARQGKKSNLKCPAGKNILVIEPDGKIKLCEQKNSIGSLRECGYDMKKILNNRPAAAMKREIIETKCNCDNSVFLYTKISNNIYCLLMPALKGLKKALFGGMPH